MSSTALEYVLRGLIAGTIASPRTLEHGAMLAYDASTRHLTITRHNAAPDGKEMGIFKAYIKRVGYVVAASEPVDLDPQAMNSQVGYRLTIAPAPTEPAKPEAKQEKLF
jgi:hypothetical protein